MEYIPTLEDLKWIQKTNILNASVNTKNLAANLHQTLQLIFRASELSVSAMQGAKLITRRRNRFLKKINKELLNLTGNKEYQKYISKTPLIKEIRSLSYRENSMVANHVKMNERIEIELNQTIINIQKLGLTLVRSGIIGSKGTVSE